MYLWSATYGWLYYVARRVDLQVVIGGGGTRVVAPSSAVMKLIPSVGIPDLPPLDGIATTPYLDSAGNLIAKDGYNPGTRLVLAAGGFSIPAVQPSPSGTMSPRR